MKIKDIIRGMTQDYNGISFEYEGLKSGVEIEAHNSIITYEAWHGAKTKQYRDFNELLYSPFFSGKSIADLVDKVDIRFI